MKMQQMYGIGKTTAVMFDNRSDLSLLLSVLSTVDLWKTCLPTYTKISIKLSIDWANELVLLDG